MFDLKSSTYDKYQNLMAGYSIIVFICGILFQLVNDSIYKVIEQAQT